MSINDAVDRALNEGCGKGIQAGQHDLFQIIYNMFKAMKEPEEVPQPDKDMFGEPPLEEEKKEEYPTKPHLYSYPMPDEGIFYSQQEIEEKLKPLIDYVKIWPPFASNGDMAIEQTLKNFGIEVK